MTFRIIEDFEDEALLLTGFAGTGFMTAPDDGMTFLAVAHGHAMIDEHWTVHAGMYACIPPGDLISGYSARIMLVTAKGYSGIFCIGGPVERTGRLRYIDGCSDTSLIAPLRQGDPCLNFLHFPDGIHQTPHTHPSHRVGMVMRGRGACAYPGGSESMGLGNIFLIPAGSVHSFHTGPDIMDIVAFHPDSVFGPTDERHQMLEATIIESQRHVHV